MPRPSPNCPAVPASRPALWRSLAAPPRPDASRLGDCHGAGRRLLLVSENAAARRSLLGHWLATAPDDTLIAAIDTDGTGLDRDPTVMLHDVPGQLKTRLRDAQPLPPGGTDVAATVPGWLARAGAGAGAILALDGIDELDGDAPPDWLPNRLPPRVDIVLGSAPGAKADTLAAAGWERIGLSPTGAAPSTAGTDRIDQAGLPLLAALWADTGGIDDAALAALDPDQRFRHALRPALRRHGGRLCLADPAVRAAADRRLHESAGNGGQSLRQIADRPGTEPLAALHLRVAAAAWQEVATMLADPAILAHWPAGAPQLLAAWQRLPLPEITLERLLGALPPASAAPERHLAATELLEALGEPQRAAELLEALEQAVTERSDPVTASILQRRATAALEAGEADAARNLLERAIAIHERAAPAGAAARSARHALATAMEAGGDLTGAERLYHAAVAEFIERGQAASPALIPALANLAAVQRAGNRLEPALENLETALRSAERRLGAEHPTTIGLHDTLGGLRYGGGDLEGAEGHYREAVSRAERASAPEPEATGACCHNLGTLLDARAQYREAETWLRHALAVRRTSRGDFDADTASTLHNLAGVLEVTGRGAEAETHYREAVAVWERLVGDEHPATATSLNNLADVLRERGELDEAARIYRRTLGIWTHLYGEEHPNALMTRAELGGVHADAGRRQEAEALLVPAVDGLTRTLGPTAGLAVDAVLRLAALRRDSNRGPEALDLLERTLAAAEGSVTALSARLQKVRRHRDALRAQLAGEEMPRGWTQRRSRAARRVTCSLRTAYDRAGRQHPRRGHATRSGRRRRGHAGMGRGTDGRPPPGRQTLVFTHRRPLRRGDPAPRATTRPVAATDRRRRRKPRRRHRRAMPADDATTLRLAGSPPPRPR